MYCYPEFISSCLSTNRINHWIERKLSEGFHVCKECYTACTLASACPHCHSLSFYQPAEMKKFQA